MAVPAVLVILSACAPFQHLLASPVQLDVKCMILRKTQMCPTQAYIFSNDELPHLQCANLSILRQNLE